MGNNVFTGEKGYTIKLTPEFKLGEGAYEDVYKIINKDKKMECAAIIFKIQTTTMNYIERLV